jgi:hypothetical protein
LNETGSYFVRFQNISLSYAIWHRSHKKLHYWKMFSDKIYSTEKHLPIKFTISKYILW